MTARKRPHGGADHGGGGGGGGHGGGASGRWLVSYSDFITLMFVVFLVLFSMARLDASKYGALAKSLRQSLGPVGPDVPPLPARGETGQAMPVRTPDRPGNLPALPDWPSELIQEQSASTERAPIPPKETPPPETTPSPNPTDPVVAPPVALPKTVDPLSDLYKAFETLPGARRGVLAVALLDKGIVLSIAGSVLFDPGKAVLKPTAQTYLDEIAGSLKGVEHPIMVEGTADDRPVGTPDALSPWDLSALRAGAVVRFLVEGKGFPGSQFVTIGHGADQASADATHRVNIVVMRKSTLP